LNLSPAQAVDGNVDVKKMWRAHQIQSSPKIGACKMVANTTLDGILIPRFAGP